MWGEARHVEDRCIIQAGKGDNDKVVAKQEEVAAERTANTAGLSAFLRVLANPERLRLLQMLLAGATDPSTLATAAGMTTVAARRQLRALAAAGLVRSYLTAGGERFVADQANLAHFNASLVQQLTGYGRRIESLSGTSAGDGLNVFSVDVPAEPDECLRCANSGFVEGVLEDLDRVLAEARQYHGRLQQLSSQVLTAHEAERKRIARELHDDTGQALTSILIRLRLLERIVKDDSVRRNVEELRDLTGNALDAVRRMAVDLRPAALDDLGLVPALHSYAEKYSNSWPIKVQFSAKGLKRRLPPNVELVLYRVAQEALTNIAKHSAARTADVALRRQHNIITVTVQDDGRGFDISSATETDRSGLGLFGMRERLALVGGTLEINSIPGNGTTIVARVPLYEQPHQHEEDN